MSIVVIGHSSFVPCFELIGASGYEEHEEGAVVATLNRLVNEGDFKLIVIHERYAGATKLIVEGIMKRGRTTLIFALIPDLTMETGMRIKELVLTKLIGGAKASRR
jgi:vacuolar-type H+-ATPase subunit F/Vma7